MASVTLKGITKTFQEGTDNEIVAVDDLNQTIEDGEFLVLLGPSGCGKTTTLRSIAGLEMITEGEIRIGDRDVSDVDAKNRDIAMVFQDYALYPHMSARDNMGFGLKMTTDLSKDEVDERVEQAAQMMGIADLLEDKPDELSGGQQQRVALGRAIVREPEVFLMDEPLSNLDAKLRAQMRIELQQLQEDLDVTAVYVTHDQVEAMTMADTVAILNNGQLQQAADPMECYQKPVNEFVAGFIGEPAMNFFDVTVDGEKLVSDTFDYPLSSRIEERVSDGDELTLGIRPEDIKLLPRIEEATDLRCDVDIVEPMGKDINVYVHLQGADGESESITVVTDGQRKVEQGESIGMRIPEKAIHLFDATTGEALVNSELEPKSLGNLVQNAD